MSDLPEVQKGEEEIYLVVRTRSLLACILHWVGFTAVIVLIVTGFYIGNPNFYFGQGEAYQAFAMAEIRTYHFIAASFLIVSFLLRAYLAFTPEQNMDVKQFMPTPKNIVNALKLAFHFGTGAGEHHHYRFINPLGGIGVFMMIISIIVMIFTGFLLYLPAENIHTIWYSMAQSFISMLGGHQNVRLIHHLVMYFLSFFVVIHIYMQIWKNIVYTESDISSIIGGYKIFPYKYIGHFADYYGLELHQEPPSKEEMDKVSTPMKEPPE